MKNTFNINLALIFLFPKCVFVNSFHNGEEYGNGGEFHHETRNSEIDKELELDFPTEYDTERTAGKKGEYTERYNGSIFTFFTQSRILNANFYTAYHICKSRGLEMLWIENAPEWKYALNFLRRVIKKFNFRIDPGGYDAISWVAATKLNDLWIDLHSGKKYELWLDEDGKKNSQPDNRPSERCVAVWTVQARPGLSDVPCDFDYPTRPWVVCRKFVGN